MPVIGISLLSSCHADSSALMISVAPAVPPAKIHQCQLSVSISASAHQCHISVPI
ncbi:unnamed protein product [Staurois parvus]|uniref:Uncharacterized protein n=1 Tax=Staurois parvus TaxID=386267 RepID=A0ABN9DDH7_9NEOB|nr:unnamed protein product [Staurois parvus]